MKKGLIIAGTIIGLLIIIMIVVPIMFKGKIIQKVKNTANQSINAKVDFSDAELSLFRSFPQLNVALKNLSVTGINEFDNVSLLNVESLSTAVNISSLWKTEGLSINSIELVRPNINLVVNKEGKANWDIAKNTTETTAPQDEKGTEIDLEKIQIINGSFAYADESTPMLFTFRNATFDLSGELKGSNSKLDLKGHADSLNFDYNGSRYASNFTADLEGGLQANFDKMSFMFLDNKLLINKLPLEVQGTFVLGEKDYNFDLTYKSPTSDFGDLLGFIPEEYQKNLKGVETAGDISFNGFVKGIYADTIFPALGMDLKIAGGRLKYPDLPREIEKVEVTAGLSKPQGDMDLTKIDIEKFDASVAGNPLTASLHIATPVSDPTLRGNLKGHVDFATLKQAIPMDSMDIKGIIDAYINFDGRYSSIEKEQYENFKTEGTISLKDFVYSSVDLPQSVGIRTADIRLNPKLITLNTLSGNMGESDFEAKGTISNYWSYMLKKGTLNGNMSLNSKYININQLIPKETAKDTTASGKPFEVPENINFTIQSIIDRALYENMTISGITGKVVVKDRKVLLDGLNMNMLSGKVVVSGAYATAKGEKPNFDFKMDIRDFDLPTAYKSLSTVRYFLPIARESTGAFNTSFSLNGKLDDGYTPVFTSLNGGGLITAKNVELIGTTLFNEIGKYFRKDLFKQVKVSDFTTNFKVVDGGLAISPFTTRIAGQEVTMSGKQSASKNLDYRIDFKVNKEDVSDEVTKYIGFVPGAENISKYPIGVNVGGTFDKPDVKVDLTEAKNLVETEFKKKAGSTIQDAVKKFGLDKLFK